MYCLQMCGLLTDEERAVKEWHGSSWTTRHDMIVSCLYLRLSREFNAGLDFVALFVVPTAHLLAQTHRLLLSPTAEASSYQSKLREI